MDSLSRFSDRLRRGRLRFGLVLDLIQHPLAAFATNAPLKDRFAATFARILHLNVTGDSALLDHFQNDPLRHAGRLVDFTDRCPPVMPQISGHFFFLFFFESVTVRTKPGWVLDKQFAAFFAVGETHIDHPFILFLNQISLIYNIPCQGNRAQPANRKIL